MKTSDASNLLTTFATNLKKARQAKHLTQTELAKLVPIAQTGISAYELGVGAPSFATLHRLADALGIPAADLLRPTK